MSGPAHIPVMLRAPHFRLWRWVFVLFTLTCGEGRRAKRSRHFLVMRQAPGEGCPACAAIQRIRLAHLRGDL